MHIERLQHAGYEQVVQFTDDDFLCIIALHNTRLGPALGGCRVMPYDSVDAAVQDVLRLSKSMTYKSSLAGLRLGGGKCVVIADRVTPALMAKVGEAVDYFGGDYIVAEDVGTTLADVAVTDHAVRLDGSANTARGVFAAIHAAARHLRSWANTDFTSVPIWVQGLGKVGMNLALRLHQYTNLYVSDLRPGQVAQATALGAHELTESDRKFITIYAPCAMGQVITQENVNLLTHTMICGAANNQLADDRFAEVLHRNQVLYCPDYLVNAGGVITSAGEIENWSQDEVWRHCDDIGERLVNVLTMADELQITPLAAANILAEARLV